jgi:hypothetical protein
MLLHLKMYEKLESMLQDCASPVSWEDMCAAVEITHGQGYVYTQHGVTRALRVWDENRQKTVIDRIVKVLQQVTDGFGVPTYLTSGTLLGLTRDNALIPHDDDIDTAYISRAPDYLNWALEWNSLSAFLNRLPACSSKKHLPGLLHVTVEVDEKKRSVRFDLFSSIVESGYLNEYPLDTGSVPIESVEPISTRKFLDIVVPIPAVPEDLLQVNYGDGWRTPDPKFRFDWASAGKQYANRITAMAKSLPSAGWLRAQIPMVCGAQIPANGASDSQHQIAALEEAFTRSGRGSILVFGSKNQDLIARAKEITLASERRLCVLDADIAGSNSSNDSTAPVRFSMNSASGTDSIVGSATEVTEALAKAGETFETVFLATESRERTNTACSMIKEFMADECHIVFNEFLLEKDGKLSGEQYQAVLHDDCLHGRALKAIGRTEHSQVIMHATSRLVANHLI